jgi:hypothetical protein
MAKTMAQEVALMGQKLDTVCTTVAKIDENVEVLKKAQAATDIHVKAIVGPPSLEDRLNASMDGKDAHKHANVMQAITGVQEILRLQQENATLKMEASIASVAASLKDVAKSVEQTEKMRKENHKEQKRWQEQQELIRSKEKESDANWKSGMERKFNIALGAVIATEAIIGISIKLFDVFHK